MRTKPILFIDFDGTLCFDRYWRSLPQDMFSLVQQRLFGRDTTLAVEWMLGKKTEVEKDPTDQYGQRKYRLNNRGTIKYFGSNEEKMNEYWGRNGFAIALALGNLVVTLSAAILTNIYK